MIKFLFVKLNQSILSQDYLCLIIGTLQMHLHATLPIIGLPVMCHLEVRSTIAVRDYQRFVIEQEPSD